MFENQKRVPNSAIFDEKSSIKIFLDFSTASMPAWQKKKTKNKRGANWTTDEELALIDLANLKEDSIFGKNNGCGDVFFFNYANAW